jgi:hypothetical protein
VKQRLRERFGRAVFAAVAAVVLLSSGCVPPPARLDLTHASVGPVVTVTPLAGAARIRVLPLEDKRMNTDNLGRVAGRVFSANEIGDWANQRLQRLSSTAFVLVPDGGTGEPPRLTLQPRLLKTYVDSVSVSKSAVVVIEVEFSSPASPNAVRVYRGQQTNLNWSSSAGELTGALEVALDRCALQLQGEIEARLRAGL